MKQTYTLSEPERAAVQQFLEQANECKRVIDKANAAIRERQAQLKALQGAVNGAALLIARQQGLFTGTETVQFTSDFTAVDVFPGDDKKPEGQE